MVVDLVSKAVAFRKLGQAGRRVVIPGVLELQTMVNDGALFGIGGGRTTLFLAASGVALVLVIYMFALSPARSRLLHLGLAAILAGAAGNMYDRAFVRLVKWRDSSGSVRYYVKSFSADGQRVQLREYPPRAAAAQYELPAGAAGHLPPEVGYVRDFIKISARIFGGRELWPWVFNVADMLLVGGVGLLAVRLWFEGDGGEAQETPAG
jgi:lipoprotein signal peptidase